VRRRGQGRKRSTMARDDRFIETETKKRSGRRTSARTVSRRLKKIGLKAYRTKKAPLSQRRHRVARLGFAREHKNWENDQWTNALFTDDR